MKNGKIISTVVLGFVVVVSLMSPTQAISTEDLRDLLRKHSVEGLKNLCNGPKLPVDQIEEAYKEIFRVYSDDAVMTEKTRQNYDDFIEQAGKRGEPDFHKEMQAHSDAVCDTIRSFFDRVGTLDVKLNGLEKYIRQIWHRRFRDNL